VAGAGDAGCHYNRNRELREEAGRTLHRHAPERRKPSSGGHNIAAEGCS
jgi:hypothetical protein